MPSIDAGCCACGGQRCCVVHRPTRGCPNSELRGETCWIGRHGADPNRQVRCTRCRFQALRRHHVRAGAQHRGPSRDSPPFQEQSADPGTVRRSPARAAQGDRPAEFPIRILRPQYWSIGCPLAGVAPQANKDVRVVDPSVQPHGVLKRTDMERCSNSFE
jgi:hypothetical protein